MSRHVAHDGDPRDSQRLSWLAAGSALLTGAARGLARIRQLADAPGTLMRVPAALAGIPGALARWRAGAGAWWAAASVRSRLLVIGPSVLGIAAVAAVVVYAVAVGGTQPSVPRSAAEGGGPNPDTTEPMPTYHVPAPVIPVALPSTSAVPLPVSEKPQAVNWNQGKGGAALRAVTTEAGAAEQASGVHEYVEMKTACVQLASAVTTAQAAPPIPVPANQALYQKALSELGKAATECQAAISEQPEGEEYVATTEDKALLNQAKSALAMASKDLYKATGGITALGTSA